ncbi:hypothetical protein JB92DRAFT_2884170 [Gautieria morchelliformis]|nr:hypothetical protein JB92DRAFT_2884170 [Gautieria morchelliformis]
MDADREMLRLWNLVSEITEQLNQNREITSRLQSHAGEVQEQAGQASDGATLRRFNTDLSKEHFTSELERHSVALVMENQSLLHENKQLNSLMHEYEQTLETVMGKLRGHCQAAQTHQLTLSRHYEMLLTRERGDDLQVGRETDIMKLQHLFALIRRVLRSMAGKDPLHEEQLDREAEARGELQERLQLEQDEEWQGVDDWAADREIEIDRLERENAQFRHALGVSVEQERELGLDREQGTSVPSPFAERPSLSRPSSFRDDRGRGNGRLNFGLLSGGGLQRRSAPTPGRRGLGERVAPPERVTSPPNDIRWEPVVESL